MADSNSRSVFLCLIFATGAIVLSLELITSRVLAPFFGVSLYIWTAILSITLTFLALGYQLGGWLTSKVEEEHHESLLLYIPIISILFIWLSCVIYPIVFPALSEIGLIAGSFIGSFILLAFPLVLLSSINPILIAISSRSSSGKDAGAGFVFCVSTVGSVAGVLLTALLIVPNLTNFSAMLINSILLGIFTLIAHFLTKGNRSSSANNKIWLSGFVVILLCASLLFWKNSFLNAVTSDTNAQGTRYEIFSEYSSHYGNLKVVGLYPEGKEERFHYMLFQDGLTQNFVSKDGRSLSLFSYNLEKLSHYAPHAKSALILGFGAGVLPQTLSKRGLRVDVVEINPDTLTAAEQFFKYNGDGVKTYFEDARMFVKNCKDEYDIVILDLFQGDGMPEHITTQEFFEDAKNCLTKDGLLLSNVFISLEKKDVTMSLLATVHAAFDNVHFFYTQQDFEKDDKFKFTNANILATKKPLPKNIKISLSDVPQGIQKKVYTTLGSHKEYDRDALKNYQVISDNGNTFSSIFADSSMQFRKNMVSIFPSRIMIN